MPVSSPQGTLRNYDAVDDGNIVKAIGQVSKTTISQMRHAFLYIFLPSLHNYDVKWPEFRFTWEREYLKCQRLFIRVFRFRSSLKKWPARKTSPLVSSAFGRRILVPSPLLSSNINSLLLSAWATWYNLEKVKGREVDFSMIFLWTSPLSDRKVPIFGAHRRYPKLTSENRKIVSVCMGILAIVI